MSESRFVVRRLNWREAGALIVRLPGEVRLASFDTFEAADADRARREAQVRDRVNPFRCGAAWHALTAFPEGVFRDWLSDVALAPPDGATLGDWAQWWADGSAAWPAEHRARVWEGLDRVRFFETIERPASAVAYAVMRVLWEYNDSWYDPGTEGGLTVRAFRSRERAETECARLEAEARTGWVDDHGIGTQRWQLDEWPKFGEDTAFDAAEALDAYGARLFEVVEIDVGGEA
jgi:hypothetical protein